MPTNRREVITGLTSFAAVAPAIMRASLTAGQMKIIDITEIVWNAEGQVAMIGVPRPPAAR